MLVLAELFKMAEVQSRPAGATRGRGRGRRAPAEEGKKLVDGDEVGEETTVLNFSRGNMGRIIGKAGATK